MASLGKMKNVNVNVNVNVKCKCKCNLFTHEAPKSSRNSLKGVRAFQVELEFSNVVFCGGRIVEGGEPENPEKKPRSRDKDQQQTQPTYDAESGISPKWCVKC